MHLSIYPSIHLSIYPPIYLCTIQRRGESLLNIRSNNSVLDARIELGYTCNPLTSNNCIQSMYNIHIHIYIYTVDEYRNLSKHLCYHFQSPPYSSLLKSNIIEYLHWLMILCVVRPFLVWHPPGPDSRFATDHLPHHPVNPANPTLKVQ